MKVDWEFLEKQQHELKKKNRKKERFVKGKCLGLVPWWKQKLELMCNGKKIIVKLFIFSMLILSCLLVHFLPSFLSQQGANRISWAQSAPLGHCLLGVCSKIFLKSFEQKTFLKSWKILKFSSHYYVIVYIKNLLKICHCQKSSSLFIISFTI